MPQLEWNTGTKETLRRMVRDTWVEERDCGTYIGHGGERERYDRCIDVWTGTSSIGKRRGDELVFNYLVNDAERMRRDNIWYIVWNVRIYSLKHPQFLNSKLSGGQKYNARDNTPSNLHTNHAHFSTFAPPKAPLPEGPTLPPLPTIIAEQLVPESRNESVRLMQKALNVVQLRLGAGHQLVEDGHYGPRTQLQVKILQKTWPVGSNAVDGDMGKLEAIQLVGLSKLDIVVR